MPRLLLRSPGGPVARRALLLCAAPLGLLSAAQAQERWGSREEYRIRRAAYGTPEQFIDVTEPLGEIGRLDQRVQVSNRLFGRDPAPGQPKLLRLYVVGRGGRSRVMEFPEGSWIDGTLFAGWSQGGWGEGGNGEPGWGGDTGYEDGGRGEFEILRARWGTPRRNADVTRRVRELAATSRGFRADNGSLGGDPARGEPKLLRIEARTRGGRTRSFEYPEGAWVDDAPFSNWGGNGAVGVEIVSADYGSGNGRRIDVSGLLRQGLQQGQGRLQLQVGNASFGQDPAPGVPKWLRLRYRASGSSRVLERTLREDEWLSLP